MSKRAEHRRNKRLVRKAVTSDGAVTVIETVRLIGLTIREKIEFVTVAGRAGLQKEELLLVDDHEWNIEDIEMMDEYLRDQRAVNKLEGSTV